MPEQPTGTIAAWEVLDLLTGLVEKSMVLYEEQEGEGRYRLLETVRQYGRERLQQAEEKEVVRDRHVDFFLALAEQIDWVGRDQAEELARIDRAHDDLRVALDRCLQKAEPEKGLRLGGALWDFWHLRGYLAEGRELLMKLLALPGSDVPRAARAAALHGAGALAHQQGDYAEAWQLNQESLSIQRELGNRWGIAFSLNNLGNLAHDQGDHAAAQTLLEESLAIKRELDCQPSIATTLSNLGGVIYELGDFVAAQRLCEESLAIRRELGDRWGIAYTLNNLGNIAYGQGDYAAARRLHEESLIIKRDLNDRQGIAESLGAFAALAIVGGHSRRAARLMGMVAALREAIQTPLPPKDRERTEAGMTAARHTLGEEAFATTWAEGRAMSLDQAIAYALEESSGA